MKTFQYSILSFTISMCLSSCSVTDSESVPEGASEADLQTATGQRQKECHKKKFILDPVEDESVCDNLPLATWSCSREGLKGRLEQLGFTATDVSEALAALDKKTSDGFSTFEECGELTDSNGISMKIILWQHVYTKNSISGTYSGRPSRMSLSVQEKALTLGE